MKVHKFHLLAASAAMLAFLGVQTVIAKQKGTSIYHFMVSATMEDGAAEGDAQGSLEASIKRQGNADHEALDIEVSGLESNATYTIHAQLLGQSNLTEVVSFDTDADGAASLHYVRKGSIKGHGGGSPGGDPLPNELKPLIDVLALEIVNASTQTVLSVDLTDPDKFQYLVKRGLDDDGVEDKAAACLRLKGHNNTEQLRIKATGLTADTEYWVTINDEIADSATTDSKGRLSVKGMPSGAPHILEIKSIAVVNSETNSVLSTELP